MDNKKLSKKILTQAGLALLIILPLLVGVFYMRGVISNMVDKITKARDEFAEHSASLNSLVQLQSQYKNFGRAYLNVLYNIVPQKDELINISQELESIAIKNNLGFGFSFLGENNPEGNGLGYIQYSLNISGDSVNQISNFLQDLNEFQYINSVDGLSITRKKEGENEEVIISSVKGRVFFREDTEKENG